MPLILPAWLDLETWADYLEVRKRKRAPSTDRALKLTLRKLDEFMVEGYSPTEILEQSIQRGWVGVFPVYGQEPKRETAKVKAKYSANDIAAYEEMKRLFPNESWPV